MLHKKMLAILFVIASLVLIVSGCGGEETQEENVTENTANETNDSNESTTGYPAGVEENPVVTITMENGNEIVVELYPETAPNTVANFISLVEDGFYDGLIFHRVIPGFMIQGGDPDGNGTGGPGYAIAGEFASNGYETNTLTHERGVISMARSGHPDSAGSQFFIMAEESTHLDGEYAAFGKVIEGIEAVDTIVSVERDSKDKPLEDQTMKSVTVDTKGYPYPEPKKIQ